MSEKQNEYNNLIKIRDNFALTEIKLGLNHRLSTSLGVSLLALALPFFFIQDWFLIGLGLYLVSIIFFVDLIQYLLFIQVTKNFNINKRIEDYLKTM